MDNNGQQWTTIDINGQQLTTIRSATCISFMPSMHWESRSRGPRISLLGNGTLNPRFSAGQTGERIKTFACSTAPRCAAQRRLLVSLQELESVINPIKSKVFTNIFKTSNIFMTFSCFWCRVYSIYYIPTWWGSCFSDKTEVLELPSVCFQGCECPKWLDYQVAFQKVASSFKCTCGSWKVGRFWESPSCF